MKRAHSVTPPRKLKMGPSADGEGFMDDHGGLHTPPPTTTVAVVGAGPSGLMLASNLVRYGIKTTILDDRPDKTSTGKADGMQPKTIETFKQLRLADDLLRKGVKVYDISFWESTVDKPLHRTSRQSHYPDHVGASNPFVLLAHQGMIEDVLIQDMEQRGVFVSRSSPFIECSRSAADGKMHVIYEDATTKAPQTMEADYLIGCDGAHSKVRPFIPEAKLIGEMTNASWGVLDGVINTDFPDLWSKVAVRTHHAGSILWIPRERNMTRLYVELSSTEGNRMDKSLATPEYVINRARQAMAPYTLEWKSIEWFGNYVVSQRVANHFADTELQIFIAGDAGHCHSALAAQGANTSMHDSFNLAWKLNLVARDLAPRSLLATYETERKKIAQDLIDFDAGHVKAFSEGDEALTRNFDENIRFISGVGAEYAPNILNQVSSAPQLSGPSINILKPGALLTPARVTRFIDANPVDIELDIPLLGQFRIYMFTPSLQAGTAFLESLCNYIQSPTSFLSRASMRANKSYAADPPPVGPLDEFAQLDRYTPVSKLFTYALVTRTAKCDAEITSLPALLQASRWTFYLDDVITGGGCTEKWLGSVPGDEVAIVNVRPDGYVGSIWRCGGVGQNGEAGSDLGRKAGKWLDEYYGGFLKG
ncbi:FAD binding domain-containing protein [Histoplasma ohiense]|nr:FAD binding domain-containing protein [Histoplasma ohiense (nom. inval.)]